MNLTSPFSLSIYAIVGLSLLGLPVGHAMIAGSILYLYAAGLDMGTAAEQLLNGMYSSFLLLAIPLFMMAADFMNAGSIMDRLLRFCNAIVGRFRGGLAHVNVVQSMIFAGMSGSAVADAAGLGKMIIEMMRTVRYSAGYAAAITAVSSTIGPIIPPSIPMVLYALVSDTSIGYLFLGGFVPGIMMGIALMMLNVRMAEAANVPVEVPVPLRELPRSPARVPGADDAGDPALRHLRRRHHADGSRCDRGRLCAVISAFLYRGVVADALRLFLKARARPLRSAAHRRRA